MRRTKSRFTWTADRSPPFVFGIPRPLRPTAISRREEAAPASISVTFGAKSVARSFALSLGTCTLRARPSPDTAGGLLGAAAGVLAIAAIDAAL